jgi:hypothetical protein
MQTHERKPLLGNWEVALIAAVIGLGLLALSMVFGS